MYGVGNKNIKYMRINIYLSLKIKRMLSTSW